MEPRAAGPASEQIVPPALPEPPVAFQSPEPDCANVQPLRVVGGVQPSELLRRVDPVYPDSVRRKATAGIGIFELVINEQGRICAVRVLRGLRPAIDRAMVDAVRQWTFRPARRNGKPVAVAYVVTVRLEVRP
jgi:protein TonB